MTYHIVYKEANQHLANGITLDALDPIMALQEFSKQYPLEWVITIYRINSHGYLDF